MGLKRKWLVGSVISGGLLGLVGLSFGQGNTPSANSRPVTVADSIRMTHIAGPFPESHYAPKSDFAVFSPNGRYFAFAVSRGDIERNRNNYSLLLFRTADVDHPVPRVLVSFSSSSNRAAISDLHWSEDGTTLFFLGAQAEEATQLYSFRHGSGELKKLTDHPTSLVSYAVSGKDRIVYAAAKPEASVTNESVLRRGFHVTTENPSDLVRGRISDYESELFLTLNTPGANRRLQTHDPFDSGVNDLYLSPDGQYLVVKTDAKEISDRWSEYEDTNIRIALRTEPKKGLGARILHYELIDTQTGRSEVLLDSPATYRSSDVIWSPDSKSLVLCGVYLPLNVEGATELALRRSNRFVVEITLPGRTLTKIAKGDLEPVRWDRRSNILQVRSLQNSGQTVGGRGMISYRKTGAGWERVGTDSLKTESQPDILAAQDLNLPPRIVVVDPKTSRKTLLIDLNPQFASLSFGKVEEVGWMDSTGNRVEGGLYLPPDYTPGTRYPLVIQTHGFDAHAFSIDGYYTTAFAAQPLASKGIVVLQVNDIFYDSLVTPDELQRAMTTYENAVEYLDKKGVIDPSRIGLVGFSRTSLYVKYTLTHSTRHFAAAIVCDGVDGGYFQYLLFSNWRPSTASESDALMGTPPFGPGLSLWLKRSPGFLLYGVRTPVQIQALEPFSVLSEWEWFAGLRRLGKPVDFVYLPTGTHILVKPWDRVVSQGGTVDWFCFWLKGEEDPDPTKAEQYTRWRELRKLQEQNEKTANAASPTAN